MTVDEDEEFVDGRMSMKRQVMRTKRRQMRMKRQLDEDEDEDDSR